MKQLLCLCFFVVYQLGAAQLPGVLVAEVTSPYHQIQVVDHNDIRTLSFDGTMETRMSLRDPLKGHFEYTEFFHLAWLWNPAITNVLMMGLGGGSVQRAFAHYYPQVTVETVEIDPMVLQVAKEYFGVKETPQSKVYVSDGRVFLRRSEARYDVIVMDAYVKSRYGSFIPYHLVTKEFFKMASDHLGTNGVLAYNVIASLQGFREDLLGSIYKTMKTVFPQVYMFPASDSQNVVLIATKSSRIVSIPTLQQRATDLGKTGFKAPPHLRTRIQSFRRVAPFTAAEAKELTDDFAPVDGILRGRH